MNAFSLLRAKLINNKVTPMGSISKSRLFKTRDESGFTLIEFMVGMIVLSVILAITLLTSSVFTTSSIYSQREGTSTNNAQIAIRNISDYIGNAFVPTSANVTSTGITNDCSTSPSSFVQMTSPTDGPFVSASTNGTSIALCALSGNPTTATTAYTYQISLTSPCSPTFVCQLAIDQWPASSAGGSTQVGTVSNVYYNSASSSPLFNYYAGQTSQGTSTTSGTDIVQLNINFVAVDIPGSPQTTILDNVGLGSGGF